MFLRIKTGGVLQDAMPVLIRKNCRLHNVCRWEEVVVHASRLKGSRHLLSDLIQISSIKDSNFN